MTQATAQSRAFVVALLLVACGSYPNLVKAQAGSGGPGSIRTEIPIREVILSDGERRYGVPIKVGSTSIEAGLDSGSTGLRILPGTLAEGDAKGGGADDSYSYGAGTKFDGQVGTGSLTIGSLSGSSTMQLIQTVGCRPDMPRCPASRIPISKFGIQGSGLPGEGFRAILGVNMAKADAESPLPAIGASRWIIELPRPGSGVPGKIVLNPSDDELKGFVLLPIISDFRDQKGGLHDAVKGCILNDTSKDKACGALLMDTGAPGIAVDNGKLGFKPWPNGTPATLAFYSATGLAAMEQFTVGNYQHASRLSFEDGPTNGISIFAGLSPYFAFDVLYDPSKGMIGLKPRPVETTAPQGQLVEGSVAK
jgi:hypothetical protein